ncbi:MAG: hypothetical protein ACJAT7_003567, partial [Psychromonas sp.]
SQEIQCACFVIMNESWLYNIFIRNVKCSPTYEVDEFVD